jgi:hypothetical protein
MTLTTFPLEKRIILSPHDGRFYLLKEKDMIPLPFKAQLSILDPADYTELATKIDNTMSTFDKLMGQENNYSIPTGIINESKGEITIRYFNQKQYSAMKDSYSPNFDRNPWMKLERTPSFGRIHYFKNDTVEIELAPELMEIATLLLGAPVKPTQTDTEFSESVESIIEAIDNLFTQEGFQQTTHMRSNLISLAYGMTGELVVSEKIHNLLNTTLSKHRINNPQLIHLAAKGVHDNILKMFYAHETYPESVEEMVGLAAMPFEMLYSIWTGNK